MTEKQLRQRYVNSITQFLGSDEGSGGHKTIIDAYNSYKPHPRGYKMTYTADWCAATVSAGAILCDLTDIIPVECSCNNQIALFKKLGRWEERDDYRPEIGDIIYYDWDDSGSGDNRGEVEHVGAVVSVNGGTIKVIEGNKNNAVGYRTMKVNGRYIRGYGCPDYASMADGKSESGSSSGSVSKVDKNVLEWQKAAIKDGFSFPKYGADGEWGNECRSVARRTLIKKGSKYKHLNKFLQELLWKKGYDMTASRKKEGGFDGIIGSGSVAAIKKFQENHDLDADGKVGVETWTELLGY